MVVRNCLRCEASALSRRNQFSVGAADEGGQSAVAESEAGCIWRMQAIRNHLHKFERQSHETDLEDIGLVC